MTRRQAKKCVTRHLCDGRPLYPWHTWRRVLQTMRRHRLAFWGRGDWRPADEAAMGTPDATGASCFYKRFKSRADARAFCEA